MPKRLALETDPSDARGRLLEGLAGAIDEKGYGAATIADVVRHARVSKRTFYEHFSDKEECFLAAYDVVVEGLVRAVGDAYNREDQWRDKVRSGLGEFLRFLAAEPDFARMCIVEVLAAGPSALQRRDGAMRMFTVFFEAGRQEAGEEMPPLPALVSESVVGAIYEVIYSRILRNRTEELPDLLPDMMYIALVPYLGPDEAARDYLAATAGRIAT